MNSGAGRPAPERIVAKGTLSEVLSQLLTAEARSAIAAAGKQVVTFADQQRPVLATLLKRLVPLALNMEVVFQAPRAASYEPLLIQMGYAPVAAQILSLWILTNGRRWAKDLDVSRRKLASALRGIVKAADQSPLVMERRAAVLLPLLDDWTRPWVETAIADGGVPLSFEEFRDLVREAAEGQPSACGRLCEIAPQIFRHVPKARGASLKAPTVTHALLRIGASSSPLIAVSIRPSWSVTRCRWLRIRSPSLSSGFVGLADRIAAITSASISGAGTRAIDPRLGFPCSTAWET